MNNWQNILPFIQELTKYVGDRLLADFEQARVAIAKDDGSLVTKSDRWADAYIRLVGKQKQGIEATLHLFLHFNPYLNKHTFIEIN